MNAIKGSFAAFIICVSLNTQAVELTENSVKQLISTIASAVSNHDAAGVADILSDDAVIVMNIDVQGLQRVIRLSKKEYMEVLQRGWSSTAKYQLIKTNEKIAIYDNKASVTSHVNETIEFQGKLVKSTSKEKMILELVGERLLIMQIIYRSAI